MDGQLKGDDLPPDDHLALHCQPKVFIEVAPDGNPVGITVDAFRVDENGISMNWVEYEVGDAFDQKLLKACAALARSRTVRKTHRVGVFVVSEILSAGKVFGRKLRAIHDPMEHPIPNPGHALVTGVCRADGDLLNALTTLVDLRPFPQSPSDPA